MGHYKYQCFQKKRANQQQKQFVRSVEASAKGDELSSKLKTTFSMVLRLSTNTIYGVGWYVDNGASKHVTFKKKDFYKLQESEDGKKWH